MNLYKENLVAGIDSADLRWRKSSKSTSKPNCVEVALAQDAVAARDSKNPEGGILVFPGARWDNFLTRIRNDAFEA